MMWSHCLEKATRESGTNSGMYNDLINNDKGTTMIAQFSDMTISISGDTLDKAAWAFIGFAYGLMTMIVIDLRTRTKLRKV